MTLDAWPHKRIVTRDVETGRASDISMKPHSIIFVSLVAEMLFTACIVVACYGKAFLGSIDDQPTGSAAM